MSAESLSLDFLKKILGTSSISDEILAQAQQIWQTLDDLALSNPEEYRTYVQKIHAEATTEHKKRAVQKSLAILIQGSGYENITKFALNVCHSKAVPKQVSPDTIPIVMSEIGKTDYQGIPTAAIDVVFSEEIVQKAANNLSFRMDLLALSCSCVLETFSIELDQSTSIFKLGEYIGPYGWNDKTGQALKSNDLETTSERRTFHGSSEPVLSPEDIIQSLNPDPSDNQCRIPPISTEIQQARSRNTDKKLIEEIPIASETTEEEANKWTLTEHLDSGVYILRIFLGGITSIEQIDITADETVPKVMVESNSKTNAPVQRSLSHRLPDVLRNVPVTTATFVKSKSVLKLKFEL